MAPAPRPAAGAARLRRHAALSTPPFRIDPGRLYEVSRSGAAWTEGDPAEAAARLRRMRWLFGIGLTVNAVTWTASGAAFALGGPHWGAGFGLLAVLTAPLLGLPALAEAFARRRARHRHRSRPKDFAGNVTK
ncbi:hypothetical protein [Falsiroseomonas tokyonensis]|uniref:Uncharacterized protein n=1 Tax=Falsiroseomonas tokyonensis TaxID=430521 RepID=A0ABV7BVD0_9PROT|nr:hypothetical protein [Falsiroseomonas tokyonensis]MBU8538456.1 hypothetical protein [Falsiroseomonas tokyonensis]